MPRALLSVSDKAGLADFARGLADLGVELVSTGGTAAALRTAGLEVVDVSTVTGHPEILGGRVKTLHPKVHGGILARGDHEQDAADVSAAGITLIDLVVVNLYPFEETAARRGATEAEVIEQIDIGGPAMIRAAAKNHGRVAVVTSPGQYEQVLAEMRASGGAVSAETRRRLAAAAFSRTARYDAAIAAWMAEPGDLPDELTISFRKEMDLAYGENPHQRGAYYAEAGARTHLLGGVRKLHGKDLSYNNLLDVDSARGLVAEFELPAVAIIKHNNPCGCAMATDLVTAYDRALACDPVSAFGGVFAVNRTVDLALAERLAEMFVEVLWAPAYEPEALEVLTRKKNVRLLEVGDQRRPSNPGEPDLRRVLGGLLVQDQDSAAEERASMQVVTSHAPSEAQWGDLLFAWRVAKHVKSNAIIFVRDLATVGIGAGQMSRVDSVRLAIEKAAAAGLAVPGAALASDAFFPFADGPQAAIDAGVTSIVQPGGSVRDQEVVEAVERQGVAMVFTGRRHFRH
ncbi:MAG: bifunctional phosphoribosylaminoimidazolecarboxamide formyltransferase/IMP cyclohydrolase [Thermoleophilia bacterium]|nr:bifunctional phosphoribosylaminoimidazolecarboxamide formyltransferase/IMP cyclohydrolase [Thermoleophilia bacterium]